MILAKEVIPDQIKDPTAFGATTINQFKANFLALTTFLETVATYSITSCQNLNVCWPKSPVGVLSGRGQPRDRN
jgi:hypothetical protein